MLKATATPMWSVTCEDQPGGMMRRLEGLATHGVNLEFILARRLENRPGYGIVFIAPILNERDMAAARKWGFEPAHGLYAIRVESPNEPGLAYLLCGALAQNDLNLRGYSAMVVNGQFVAYLAFDAQSDVDRALKRLNQPL